MARGTSGHRSRTEIQKRQRFSGSIARTLALLALLIVALACSRGSPPTPTATPLAELAELAASPTLTDESPPVPRAVPTLPAAPRGTPTPLPAGPPDPALLAYGELLDEEGRLPLDTALELFAAYIAPLPGVTPRSLPAGEPGRVLESVIVRILAAQEELPPEVAAAIEEALFSSPVERIEIPPGDLGQEKPGLTERLASLVVPHAQAQGRLERLRPTVVTLRERIEARTGLRLDTPLILEHRARLGKTQAFARAIESANRLRACQIVYRSDVLEDAVLFEYVTLHELWHCFQFAYGLSDRAPDWIWEGQAEWIAADLATDPGPAGEFWDTWLSTPDRSLYRRSYDAIGLYAAARRAGSDPAPILVRMFGLDSRRAVDTLFGGLAYEEALRVVAMGLVRAPAFGEEWETSGPGITATRSTTPYPIREGDHYTSLDVGLYASMPLDLTVPEGDFHFLQVWASETATVGAIEFPGVDAMELAPGRPVWFCLFPEKCSCPFGPPPDAPADMPVLTARTGVATVASATGATIALHTRLLTWSQVCQRLVGTWVASFADILRANTAPYGGLPANLIVEGTVTLTFRPDGTFERGGAIAITMDPGQGRGALLQRGSYEDLGGGIRFFDVSTSEPIRIFYEGILIAEITFADYSRAGTGDYEIAGDRLSIHFVTPDGHRITHVYTRVR